MLGDNTNKIVWVGVVIGLVASLGTGALILYPDAIDNGQTIIVDKIHQFTGNKDVEENTKFTWSYSGDSATVTGFISDKASDSVEIPDYRVHDGKTYKVTSIADNAFASNNVKSLSIGNYVESIGQSAFANNSLTSLDVPGSVSSIGSQAFSSSKLTSLTLHNGLKTIKFGAFGNNHLKSLTVPKTVTSVEPYAFSREADSDGSRSMDKLVWLSNSNFDGSMVSASSIDTVELSAKQVMSSSFGITHLVLNDGVESVYSGAFAGKNIETLELSGSVKDIGAGAFNSNKIKTVDFKEGLKTIGVQAFGNNSISDIDLPKSLTRVDDQAFVNNQTKSIKVYESTSLGNNVFDLGVPVTHK